VPDIPIKYILARVGLPPFSFHNLVNTISKLSGAEAMTVSPNELSIA
jgi:hypothetical protein